MFYLHHRIKAISWSLLLLLANLFNFETEKQKNTNLYFGVLVSDTMQSGKVPTNVSGDTVTTAKTPDLLTQQSPSLPLINTSSGT
jgi:hypothetical protein